MLERVRRKPMGYDPLLSAHLCAHIVLASPDGMEVLKLSTLAYIAEREYLRLRGMPLTCDDLMVGVNGPYCQQIANALARRRADERWDRYIERRGGRIHAKAGVRPKDLDQLSPNIRTLVDGLVEQFAAFSARDLVEWMRSADNVPEWAATLADGPIGCRPRRISVEELARAFGADPGRLADSIAEIRSVNEAMSRE